MFALRPRPGAAMPKQLYAVANLSAANYLQTAIAGGEPGLSTGFGVAILARMRGPQTTFQTMAGRTNSATAPTSGWQQAGSIGTITGTRNWGVTGSSGTFQYGGTSTVMPSDIGRLQVLLMQFTGSAVRCVFDREISVLPPQAVTGFIAKGDGRMMLGNDPTFANAAASWEILDLITWGGTLTDAQLLALFDSIRINKKTPATIATGIRHRYNASETYGPLGLVAGAAAVTLPDTVTGLANDALVPVGVPTVAIVNTKLDGQTTYGLNGWSWLGHYATSVANAFTGAATGFHVGGVWTPGGTCLSTTQMLAHCLDDASTRGWFVQVIGGTLRFGVYNTLGAVSLASTYALSTADMHWPMHWSAQLTSAGKLRLFVRGAQVSTDVDIAGTYGPAASTAMRLGVYRATAPQPATDSTLYGFFAGGEVSAAELQATYATYLETGIVQGVPTKSTRLYQLPTDISAAGGIGASPLQLSDRIGTAHLLRTNAPIVDSANGNGLRGFDANYLYLSRSSPLAALTTNLYFEALVYVRSPTTYAKICGTNETTSVGWTMGVHENLYYVNEGSGSGSRGVSNAMSMNALHHLAFTIDGTGYMRLYIDGTYVIGDATKAFTADPTGEFKIYAAEPTTFLGLGVATTVPTDGEIAASAASALANKKLPGIAGKTVRLWSPPDEVAEGSQCPPGLKDRGSYALETMVMTNPPPVVSQRTTKLWNYETQPVMQGLKSFSDSSYFTNAGNIMPGSRGSFWVTVAWSVEAFTGGDGLLLSSRAGGGWSMYSTGGNQWPYFAIIDGTSAFKASPLAPISTREIGKLAVMTGVFDSVANKLRLFYRRSEVGLGTDVSGYTPATGAVYAGRDNGPGYAFTNASLYGFAYGHGRPADALIAAQHDAILANDGRMMPIRGMTQHLYDTMLDISAAGGAVPTTLLDRAGASNFTRVGSGLTINARHSRTMVF